MGIFILGLNFISSKIGPLFISDISYIILTFLSIFYCKKQLILKKKLILFIFLFYSFIILIINYSNSYFVLNDFIYSYFKFIIYFIGLLFIPNLFVRHEKKVALYLVYSIRIVCIFGIYQFIAHYLPFNIPYGLTESMTSYGILRIRSIYAEPSLFLHIVLIYFYLTTSKYRIKIFDRIVLYTSVILTFSITVYGVLAIGEMITMINSKKIKFKYRLLSYVLFIVLFVYFYSSVEIIKIHITNLILMNPSSATTRLFGGIIFAFSTPFLGVGFGNSENYYISNKSIFDIDLFTTGGAVNNILAVIKIINGYIGLFLFLWYMFYSYYKTNKEYLWIVIFSCFAWGNFNFSGFFIFLVLLDVQKKVFKLKGRVESIE